MGAKLSIHQRKALEWLSSNGPWKDAWWSGKPFCGWPKEMRKPTFYALCRADFITTRAGARFDHIVTISAAGRAALAQATGDE